jgi:hypothetical protein
MWSPLPGALAQWFTDSILRFDPYDRGKNTSNHDIDLCSIYGLTEGTCRVLRRGRGGLARLYGRINNLEYFVGIFAEEPEGGLLFGDLLNRMVAYNVFTQTFSNPLLSRNVYHRRTFTDYGLELIEQTTSIEVLVNRNVTPAANPYRASLGVIR